MISRPLASSSAHEIGRFEVTDHLELSGRGVYVVGQILEGHVGVGLRAATHTQPTFLTIDAVESIDNVREKTSRIALRFSERPSLDELRDIFPIGAVLDVSKPSDSV